MSCESISYAENAKTSQNVQNDNITQISDSSSPGNSQTTSNDEYVSTNTWAWWQLLLLGQLISIANVGTGVFSQFLSIEDFSYPTFQCALPYICLNLYFIPLALARRGYFLTERFDKPSVSSVNCSSPNNESNVEPETPYNQDNIELTILNNSLPSSPTIEQPSLSPSPVSSPEFPHHPDHSNQNPIDGPIDSPMLDISPSTTAALMVTGFLKPSLSSSLPSSPPISNGESSVCNDESSAQHMGLSLSIPSSSLSPSPSPSPCVSVFPEQRLPDVLSLSYFITPVHSPWWLYFLISLIDVESNYLIVTAFQYTTLTSVQLLDCSNIPVVLVLSYFLLATRYNYRHYIAVVVCVIGLAVAVYYDVMADKGVQYDLSLGDKIKGDFFVVLACTGYGISNIIQEFVVRRQVKDNTLTRLRYKIETIGDSDGDDHGVGVVGDDSHITNNSGVDNDNSNPETTHQDDVDGVVNVIIDNDPLPTSPTTTSISTTPSEDNISPSTNNIPQSPQEPIPSPSPVELPPSDYVIYEYPDFYVKANIHTMKRIEYLAYIGVFGAFIATLQSTNDIMKMVERKYINDFIIWYFFGFTVCMFIVYSLAPLMMQNGGALLFNLSLLTADPISVVASYAIFKESLNGLYFISLAILIIGILAYNLADFPYSPIWLCMKAKRKSQTPSLDSPRPPSEYKEVPVYMDDDCSIKME